LRVKFVACRFPVCAPVLCVLLPLVNSRLKQGGARRDALLLPWRVPFVGVFALFVRAPC
jgi:hypothetical protein